MRSSTFLKPLASVFVVSVNDRAKVIQSFFHNMKINLFIGIFITSLTACL